MNMQHIHEITHERIAASQEEAVRGLVRTNAMLEDEVRMLTEEVRRLQAIIGGMDVESSPCRVCEVVRATGDDDLCDGCREARILRAVGGRDSGLVLAECSDRRLEASRSS